MKRLAGLLIALLLLAVVALPASAQSDSTFNTGDCWFNNISAYAIDCGYMTVPEDHANPDGTTIQLAVAVIHSQSPNKEPDPVLYLAGGPGGAWVGSAPLMPQRWGLSSLLINRDVILVDQRGQGLSIPTLNCIPYRSAMDAFDTEFMSGQQVERMQECLPQFEEQGINWRAFTSQQNAADLAMIPAALGYDEYNIYGSSYGTLLGLIMLRDHPEGIRSAVLDSVLPPDIPSFAYMPENFEATFALIEQDCAADITCALAYPNLRERFFETYERLQAEPAVFEVQGNEVPITAHFFAEFVFLNSRSRATINTIPAIITAFAENDFDVILPFVEPIFTTPLSSFPNQALYMTMVCPHSAPFLSYDELIEARSGHHPAFQDAGFTPANQVLCGAWDGIPVPSQELPVSDIPTLLLTGAYDPLTPPAFAHNAAENLSNGYVIELPYTGHLVAEGVCGQQLLVNFINDPTGAPDSSCTTEISAPNFILHTTVTRPPIEVALAVLGLIALFGLGQMLFTGIMGFRRIAWRVSFRRMGYMPLIAAGVLYFLIAVNAQVLPSDFVSLGVVQTMMPVLIALQAAAVFSAGDEPSLEIELAAPRALSWVVLERLAAVFITYSLIAAGGVVFSMWRDPAQDFVMVAFSWIAPALFLSGLDVFITIRSRKIALGVIAIGFLWFMFALFSEFFLPGKSFAAPMHLIQPFMWPIHVHATLHDLTVLDYWINRLFMSSVGIGLIMSAIYGLRDSESVLLDARPSRRRQKKTITTVASLQRLKPHLTLEPVKIRVRAITQILGTAKYEFIMRWRSRGMKVFILTPLVMFAVMMLVVMNDGGIILPVNANEALMSADQLAFTRGQALVFIASAIFFIPVLYMYPIMAADAVPSDEQTGVTEILGALPISDIGYLIGKMLGVAGAALSAQLMTLGIVSVAYHFWNGAYYPGPVIDMIIGMSTAMVLLTAFAVAAGASQKTARGAIAVVIALMIVPEFLQSVQIVHWILPSRIDFYLLYVNATSSAVFTFTPGARTWTVFSPPFIKLALLSLIQMLVVSGLVLVLRRYRKQL